MNKIKCISIVCLLMLLVSCKKVETNPQTKPIDNTTVEEKKAVEETNIETKNKTIKIAALKGPTAMGLVKLMDDNKNQKSINSYDIEIFNSPDEVVPLIAKGDIDIALIPSNVASVLYNNTNRNIQILGINTLGVLYIIDASDSVKNINDLKGKTIYSSGKGASPEYVLNYLLSSNGISSDADVNIEFKSEHSEVAALLAKNADAVAILPEPFVTIVTKNNPNFKKALDLNIEWEKVNSTSGIVTGVIVASKPFIENNKEDINKFLDEYKQSVEFVNNNINEAAELIDSFDIVKKEVAIESIPYCYITYIEGDEAKNKLEGFFKVLFEQNPKSIGGAIPDEEIYYKK